MTHLPEDPRSHRTTSPGIEKEIPEAAQAPDEPIATERSLPTPTRTIRADGEMQGHPREMPGDRDSQ